MVDQVWNFSFVEPVAEVFERFDQCEINDATPWPAFASFFNELKFLFEAPNLLYVQI